jgi:hypothetical protein
MRGRSLFHRKISTTLFLAGFLVTGVFGVMLLASRDAHAQGPCSTTGPCIDADDPVNIATAPPTAASTAAIAASTAALNGQEAKKGASELLRISLTNTAAVAVLNGLNYFAQKIAYDTAVYVASGGKGQVPLIFDQPGEYFKNVGADAAGEVLGTLTKDPATFGKYGVNLCAPTTPRIALNLKLGFLASLPSFGVGHAPTPKCTWDSISTNWDTFTSQNTAQVLDNVGVMFSPGQSSLGAAIEVNNVALKEINVRKYTAGIEEAIGNGFKPVVDKISGKLKTPASTVKKTFEYSVDEGFKVKDNTTQITAGAFGAGALGVLTASLKTFAGVLTDKLAKKVFEQGFISVSDLLGLNSKPGDNNALTFDGAPPLAGRAGAELANASLLTPNILSVSSYNELLEFASCPNEGRTASNCVIDQQFFGAISRVDQGVTVTLRQAIEQGFLNRNWQLLPLAHQKNLSGNCFNEAFCYSNLVKLRRARIIPIGWELAANSEFNDVSRPITLGEAMDRFNDCPTMEDADGNTVVDESKLPDPVHPWCHLVDPEWVLKYPASSCRQRGAGPTLVSPQSSTRAQVCVDVATCVAEDASGNCVGGYGYCVREKSVWKMDADACPAQYASCTTFQRASGGSFSYLSNTLDGADCNSQNAGCRRYSTSPNAVPNPGFEDALDDAPRDWNLSGTARYHVGGRLSMRGSSAVGISGASTATTRISGLMPGLEYRLSASVLQEIENTSGIGTVTIAFLDDHGVALPPAPITTTCRNAAPTVGVALDVVSTSLGYLSGSCTVTLPAGAVAANVTLSTNAAVGNRTWFDEVGFFGGSFSDSPYDAVFMNGTAEKCAEDQAGCSRFMRLATGTLNMLRNPSFETVDVDVPAFWNGAVASRYENATLVGQEGLSAYALSTSPITQTVDGVMASAAYTFSISSRRDGTGATSGTARIQLYDSSIPPVPVSPTTIGGDCATSGSAIIVDLANGADYASSACVFTTPEEAGSLVVSLSAGANTPRILADAAQLELSVNATPFHAGYALSTDRVFLKKPPEGLNCTGSNPPPECEKFAPSCRREEVGCNLYQPVEGGSAIPAVTTDGDICPAACAGYDTFRQEPSNFSDQRFPLFLIPKSAQACTAAEAGCSEFTNIERLAQGGESREYFSYLRLCAAPGPRSGTYYTWEGNDVRGFQLRTWALLRSNIDSAPPTSADPTGGNAPCSKLAYGASGQAICADDAASVEAASCVKGLVGINPDCREFYDDLGNIHYRLYSKTIVSTEDCKQYRITRTTQSECETHGGLYRNGECRYSSYAAESVSCRSEAAGCRAYSGNASRNIRIAFTSAFESGTTDDWTVPAGEDPNDAINSTEAVSQGGHSLRVSRADISKDVEGSISVGHQYILTFWAKGSGDLSARLSHAAAGSFTLNRVTGEDVPVALTTEWRPYQIGPVEAVNQPEEGEQLIIESSGVASPLFYLDNIEFREVTENIFLIEDSWKTPNVCDESPTGDPSPQYMLGCRAYTDKDKLLKHFKSFEKLCREEAVGCEALYDTRNSDSPFAQSFNAICEMPDGADADTAPDVCTALSCPCAAQGKNVCEVVIGFTSCRYDAEYAVPAANVSPTGDTARVPADGVVYMVNDPRFRCEEANMGCTELGDRTLNPDRLAVQSWAPKLLKNLPSSYATTLCKSSEEFCQAYTRHADGAQVYFKDPDTRICTFSDGTLTSTNGVNGNGWFRKDSNEPCDPEFLEAGTRFGIWKNSDVRYEGWAGVCSPQFDMCKEFIDPEDQSSGYGAGKPYYAIMNDRLDTKTCAGRVSLQTSPTGANDASACVLFWRTDDLHKIYDAKATYEASERANGGLVAPVSSGIDDTTNIIIKVKRDRQCGEWLDCRSSETIFNPSTGAYQNVCTAFSLCAEYERVGSTTRCIRYVESSYAGKTLTTGVYASRDVSWEGMEYSGYGIPNRYPVEELVTVNIGTSTAQPELRLVRSIGACSQAYGAPCGPAGDQGTCLGPTPRVCVYPIDGGRRVTSLAELRQVQNANGYPGTSCRVYPQESAPFPSTAADPTGWDQSVSDDNNGNPVLIGPSPAFSAANICQRRLVDGVEVSSCECNYIIAKYGSTTKYLPSGGADLPQGYCESGAYENYECDPLASGARTRSNLSCCSANPAEDPFGTSLTSGCDDGARCLTLNKVDRVVGYEGQCLERDFTTPINGRSDEFACVTWRPVNLIGGSRDIYNQNQTAGYFAPADRRFYCVGNKPAWSFILNIDPSVGVRQQPLNQFFGEGIYNNRVDNYASEGGNCSNDADGAGSTRWCIYPGLSTYKNVSNNAAALFRYVVDGNPIGMLGCYEVSDPNNDVVTTTAVGPAQIIWPYIGPPIYRDQLESVFFQVTDDIYHFDIDTDPSDTDPGPGYGDATPYLNGAADDVPPEDDDGGVDNEYDFKSYTSNTSAYKIIIHDDPNADDVPFYETIPTNPYQNIFADCNDDGDDNIDSSNDDNSDSTPFTEADTSDPTRTGLKGLYFITEANKWQVDASDSEGKIGFNARFDSNGLLKSIVLQAEADSGENGEGTFGINAMGFRFKQGCDQVARVDVPGEYGLTKAYTNTLNPARNFRRVETDPPKFEDVIPYGFTSYSQACVAYGSIGTISANPPTKPWTYVASIPRFITTTDPATGVTTTVPSNSGIELPLQCTTLSSRTGSRYQKDETSETLRKIFRKITSFWTYTEIAQKGQLLVDKVASSFITAKRKDERIYLPDSTSIDDTGALSTSSTNFNGGVVPPRVASLDTSTCDTNGRCGSGKPDSITLSGKQQGLLLGADGAMNVSARFFAWASHNAMPIIRRTVFWGDFTPNEPPAKGWYKNQKPFCSPDVSDENSVGECAGVSGLTCNVNTDCPGDVACNHGTNAFGNSPGACNPTPYQFDHTYVCSLAALNIMPLCTGPAAAADNAPCYRMVSNSPVCVYRPKVQIVDNWGWCNCTGSGCRVPGGAYSSDSGSIDGCNPVGAPTNAEPWTEFEGEVRLAPTFHDAQAFTPSSGGGGGGGGSGGVAVNDSFVTSAGIFYSTSNNMSVLFNDTTNGPPATRQVVMVTAPTHGTMSGICDPRDCFTITPEGAINYHATAGYHGTDSFTYKIVQNGNDSNVATVTITIP